MGGEAFVVERDGGAVVATEADAAIPRSASRWADKVSITPCHVAADSPSTSSSGSSVARVRSWSSRSATNAAAPSSGRRASVRSGVNVRPAWLRASLSSAGREARP